MNDIIHFVFWLSIGNMINLSHCFENLDVVQIGQFCHTFTEGDNMSIGNKIMYQRKLQRMKQAELADKIGVSTRTLQRWELEEYSPTMSDVSKIAQVLNIPISELLDDNIEQSSAPNIRVVPTQSKASQETNTGMAVLTLESGRKVEVPATPEGFAFLKDLFAMSLTHTPAVTA